MGPTSFRNALKIHIFYKLNNNFLGLFKISGSSRVTNYKSCFKGFEMVLLGVDFVRKQTAGNMSTCSAYNEKDVALTQMQCGLFVKSYI